MDTPLELHALPHPDPRVRRLGFDLTHPYVEQCWSAVVGPSGIAILRRLPALWAHEEPARLPAGELARSLGLGSGTGQQDRFPRSVQRLVQFRLAVWLEQGAALGVYSEVAPMAEHHLRRVPDWTRSTHERLLGDHLDLIASGGRSTQVTGISVRLDRLQQAAAPHQRTSALGR